MYDKGARQEESWVPENSGVVGQWDQRGKTEDKYRRWCELQLMNASTMNMKSYLTLAIAKTLTCAWPGQDTHVPNASVSLSVYLTIVLRTVVEMS